MTGGYGPEGAGAEPYQTILGTVEKYSPATDAWVDVAPMPGARQFHSAVSVGSDMYVIGGHDGSVTVNSVFRFDSSGLWSHVAPLPAALIELAACALGTHMSS